MVKNDNNIWMEITKKQPDFKGHGGVLPVIVQDKDSCLVYPLIHIREEELKETQQTGKIVFYSIYNKTRIEGVLSDGTVPLVEDIFVDSMGGSLLYLISCKKEKRKRWKLFRFLNRE